MPAQITDTMSGLILPGNSTAELREFPVPAPGHGEVLIRMKSSTICGSDIRCIYHQHLGKGPEGYQPGTIAGHVSGHDAVLVTGLGPVALSAQYV
jgi:threonine dehydrogenase-like Zn-dependent dehydrogenase